MDGIASLFPPPLQLVQLTILSKAKFFVGSDMAWGALPGLWLWESGYLMCMFRAGLPNSEVNLNISRLLNYSVSFLVHPPQKQNRLLKKETKPNTPQGTSSLKNAMDNKGTNVLESCIFHQKWNFQRNWVCVTALGTNTAVPL